MLNHVHRSHLIRVASSMQKGDTRRAHLLYFLANTRTARHQFRNDRDLARFIYLQGGGGGRFHNEVSKAIERGEALDPESVSRVVKNMKTYLKVPDGMSMGGPLGEKNDHAKLLAAIEELSGRVSGRVARDSMITEQDFDSLRPGQRFWMTITTGMSARGEREFEVGRTTYSKKYNVYSKTIYPVEDGVAVKKGRAPYTMFKRDTGVSVGFGGMGTVVKSFRKAASTDKQASYDRDFMKLYAQFDKKDYWDLATQIRNKVRQWESLQGRGDPEAAKWTPESIEQALRDNQMQGAYNNLYLPLKKAIQKADIPWLVSRVRYDQPFMLAMAEALLGEKLPRSNKALKAYFTNMGTLGRVASDERVAVDLPPDVERYVEEGKAQGMPESKAWAVAWSRYCKYKNPGDEHCKKSPGEYFTGKKAFGERMRSATEKEYNTAIRNAPGARKEHIDGGPRTMDVEWKDRGTLVAKKTILYKRGKVSQELYMVNPDYLNGRVTASQRVAVDLPSEEDGGKPSYDDDFKAGFAAGKAAYAKDDKVSRADAEKAYKRVSRKHGSWWVDGYSAAIDLARGAYATKPAQIAKKLKLAASEDDLRRRTIRLASTFPAGSKERKALLAALQEPRVASKPINPQVNRQSVRDGMAFMTYRIDPSASAQGTSKFYEGFIEPKDGGYSVVRVWGALTDRATAKNTRTKETWHPDLSGAQRALQTDYKKRISHHYTDAFGPNHRDPATGKALRQGQYPLGLFRPGVGFGWGTEDASSGACSMTLRFLRDKINEAIAAIGDGQPVTEIAQDVTTAIQALNTGDVDDRTTSSLLKKRLNGVLRRLAGGGRFLPDPEQKRIRADLVWLRNYIESQTAFCG